MHDLKFTLRQLARSPLHAATIVLILALGIGANTAIFSLVNGVLLKPLTYPEADRLVLLRQQLRGNETPFSWPNLQDLRRDNHVFESVGIFSRDAYTVTGRGAAEQVKAATVNADFFPAMRIPTLLGRAFSAEDDTPGAAKVVVLRESFWRRKLGGDAAALGQALTVNGQSYTIVGVMPDALTNPAGTDFWMPIAPFADNDDWRNRRNEPGLFAFGRLRPGVTFEQAQADVLAIGQRLQRDFPADNSGILPVMHPLREVVTGSYRDSLTMLMGAVGLLLVIACTNVASLQLARGFSRAHEFSIRAALGAGRAPLLRLLLIESLVLALAGGALGLLFAFWSVDGIRAISPAAPRFQALAVDRVALLFSAVLSLGAGIASGLWPAWRASRVDLRTSLHSGGQKGILGGASQFTRQALVALQVALTVVLLAGAGLFARSLAQIAQFRYGFDPANLLLVNVSLPTTAGHYDTDEKRIAFFANVRDRVAALPGVRSVGLNYSAPLRMDWSQMFHIDGRPSFPAGQEPGMGMGVIDPNYFPTLGLPILQGRNFDASDKPGSPRALIIDQRFAATFWPGENPVGKIVLRGNPRMPIERRRAVVVGVVPTVEADGFADGPRLYQGYLAQSQTGNEAMNLIVRTAVAPRSLVESIRTAVAAIDPNVPAFDIATMEELIAQQSGTQRLYSLLIALFAGAATLLSSLGLYGIIHHAVGSRRREIGVRMALGALSHQVVALVLRQGMLPLAIGLGAGLAGALAGGHLIARLLFHVSPYDPVALAAACALFALVGLIALWLPARRASKVDPMIALRAE